MWALLAPLIAPFLEGISWLFKSRIGLFLTSALAWLGINYGTVHLVLDPAIQVIHASMMNFQGGSYSGLSSYAWQWIGVLHFDRAVTMVVSAYVTKQGVASARLAWFKRGTSA